MIVSQTKTTQVNGTRWHVPTEYVSEVTDTYIPWQTSEERQELVKQFMASLSHKISLIDVNGFQDEHVAAMKYAQTGILFRECYGLDYALRKAEEQLERAGQAVNRAKRDLTDSVEIPAWKLRQITRNHEQAQYGLAMIKAQRDAALRLFHDITGNEWKGRSPDGKPPQAQENDAARAEFEAKYGKADSA